MQKSIRRKLIIYIVPIVAFILFLGCTFIVLNSRKIIEQEIYQSLLSRQETRFNDIELKVSEIKGTVDSFSSNIKNTYDYLDINTYDKILKETLNNNTKLQSIAVWFEPYTVDQNEEYANAFVERDNLTPANNEYYNAGVFDYLNHELYVKAKEMNQSFFTEPHYSPQMDSYVSEYITPIQNDNGEFIGCITASFKLNELKTYIDAFAYDSINFYIVDGTGEYVAHDDIDLVNSKANFLEDYRFKNYPESILNTKTGFFEYSINNQDYIVYYNTYSKYDWKLIYEIPTFLVTEPLFNIKIVAILIFTITLCLIIALLFYFSSKFIHKPFKLLLTEFKNISYSNLDSDITEQLEKTDTEFSDVGKALADMKLNLIAYRDALESKNQKLEESENALRETVTYSNAVISALPVMMFVFDRDGYCIESHGTDQFNNRPASFYVGKHPNNVLGDANRESKDLIEFLDIIKTIDYSDGIIHKSLPVSLYGKNEVFDHSLTLCRDNAVISLCRRTTDTVNYMENMKYLSNYDELTGAFNSRYFYDILKNYITPQKLPISVVILDVNGFKAINDEYGYSECDQLLIELTASLNKINSTDKIVARIAGDEFAVILPNKTKDEAESIFEELNSNCLSTVVFKIPFTISFGVETAKTETDSLIDISKLAEDLLYKQKIYTSSGKKDNTIELINSTLLAKNKREQLHSNRVSELCAEMARALGWSKLNQNKIKTAGLLHDIGKIGISDALLNKPGKLTDEEYAELQTHPEIGYHILQSSSNMKELSEYAYAHHEKWDGTGYPRGLKGDEIVIEARIIAIIDTYDAITSSRSYRDGLPKEVAIKELIRCKNTQFDPVLVDVFIEKVLQEKLEDFQD